jgi:hypothetical protein
MKINGRAARTNGRARNARTSTNRMPNRDTDAMERTNARKRMYAGHARKGVKLKETTKARVKITFTLASSRWIGLRLCA